MPINNCHVADAALSVCRPVCLPAETDLALDLTARSGLTAGWGATGVSSYQETGCGWTHGAVNHSSASDVLRKMEGIR